MIIFHHCLIDFNAVRADLRQFISMVHVNFNHAYSIACPHSLTRLSLNPSSNNQGCGP